MYSGQYIATNMELIHVQSKDVSKREYSQQYNPLCIYCCVGPYSTIAFRVCGGGGKMANVYCGYEQNRLFVVHVHFTCIICFMPVPLSLPRTYMCSRGKAMLLCLCVCMCVGKETLKMLHAG